MCVRHGVVCDCGTEADCALHDCEGEAGEVHYGNVVGEVYYGSVGGGVHCGCVAGEVHCGSVTGEVHCGSAVDCAAGSSDCAARVGADCG